MAHVIVIPYPAQGHVIPLMELSQRLVNQGVRVTFVNTEINHELVTSIWVEKDSFKELMHMVSIPDGLESWEDRSDLGKLTESILKTMPGKLEELIETINNQGTPKVTCVIADGCAAWAIRVAKKIGTKRAVFWPSSVASLAPALSIKKLTDDGIIDNKGIPIKDQTIQLSPNMPPIKPSNLPWSFVGDLATTKSVFKISVDVAEAATMTEWITCNSANELEPEEFSIYSKILPIGPLLASNRLADQAGHFWQEDFSCLKWLDQNPVCSVIYIAFGSFTIFDQRQFEELALGLELSNRPFLWVVRPGMTKETTVSYPDGYTERTRTRGRIVSWAPQQKVLAHPSVGCFLSHCGWNSTLEGVTNGVPFLCWPYISDQFSNQTYICDVWKNGLGVDRDEAGYITREEIKSKLEHLLSDKTFKEKAMNLKEKIMSNVEEGGSSHKNLSIFIDWIQDKDTYRCLE
ncbi:putative 7-deoxyloganetin glucosyltransferase [Helianthus annuus]|nr:putative 7-deoxyloganetin glucosyltransferase [Helianthus annuus]